MRSDSAAVTVHRLLTILAFFLAASARAWLHFSTPLVQGMNGGYYLVQARSLIEKFSLAIPDLPLTFTLHALLAKLISAMSNLSLDESVMLAVKIADSVLPALLVFPVMQLGKAWSRDGSVMDLLMTATAAVLCAAGAPALLMVGDFEKNSLGLALLCTLTRAVHRWVSEPGARRILLAVAVLGLIGLTHIGVFGTSLIFAATALVALLFSHGRAGFGRAGRIIVLAAPVVALAGGLVFWKFDPARVQKLLHAFSDPAGYLSSSGGPPRMIGGPAGPGPDAPRGPMLVPGLPDDWSRWAPMAAFFGSALAGAGVILAQRKTIGVQNIVVIAAAAVTVMALTGPWVQGDKLMRFQLNAVPLAVLCLLFALLRIPRTWLGCVPAWLLLVAALAPSASKLMSGPRPIITDAAARELDEIATRVTDPAATLVVAHHGLEWWVAWKLHTHIAQMQALEAADWQKYKNVWFIEDKRGQQIPMGSGGPGFLGGPAAQPRMPDGAAGPRPMPGPRGAGGMRGGPMGGPSIPEDAEVWHDGEYFRMAWVQMPPAFLEHHDEPADRLLDPFASGGF